MKRLALLSLFFAQTALANTPPATQPSDITSTFTVGNWIVPGVADGYSPQAETDEGAFRTECEASHLNYDDPLVYPGQVGRSHLHMYFGNPSTNYASTYTTLRNAANNTGLHSTFTCSGGPVNGSAYWMPAVLKDSVECDAGHGGTETCAVRPAWATVYYKTNRGLVDNVFDHTHLIPRGLGYVFGYNMALGQSDSPWSNAWVCSSTGEKKPYLANADGTQAFDTPCPSTAYLVAEVTAPECWDGTNLTSANGRTHMAYRINGGYNAACPNTHPYRIPAFQWKVFFNHEGPDDYKTWHLSSDRMTGYPLRRNGETLHSDWFGGWDYTKMQVWMNKCNGLTGAAVDIRNCVGSQIGDGTGLKQAGIIDFADVPLGSRYMALPADPDPAVDPVIGHKSGGRHRPLPHRHR